MDSQSTFGVVISRSTVISGHDCCKLEYLALLFNDVRLLAERCVINSSTSEGQARKGRPDITRNKQYEANWLTLGAAISFYRESSVPQV